MTIDEFGRDELTGCPTIDEGDSWVTGDDARELDETALAYVQLIDLLQLRWTSSLLEDGSR